MKQLLFVLALVLLPCILFAQDESFDVKDLDTQPETILTGNLETGKTMPLEWAGSSSVACFPATRFREYTGNHLLYRIQMPPKAKIKVSVTPKNKKHRINLYALRLGENNYDTPPEIFKAISCEASYPIYAGKPNFKAPSKEQSIELVSIKKSYNILIGVAGAEGVTAGDFDLKIEILK